MDFNQSPYFDDFDAAKQYYKILFKPGVAVQTREMNQLQSILQDQITKFGNHVFKEGSMVIPGQVVYNDKVAYVKLASVAGLGSYSGNIAWLEGQTLTTSISGVDGVEAKVIKAIDATATDPITLIILYSRAFQDSAGNNEVAFTANQTLYVKDNLTYTVTVQGGDGITGRSAYAAVQNGVYYLGGYFVTVPTTIVIVAKYLTDVATINAKIGVTYAEEFVSYETDSSLLDNAAGTTNVTAPGADRYKISTDFIMLGLEESQDNFFELIRIEDGVLQQIINASQYNILEETLARRTFDESGNYVVDEIKLDVRESRSNERGTWNINTAYQVGDFITAYTGTTTRYFSCLQAGVSGAGSIPAAFATADETSTVNDGSVIWRYSPYLISNRGYYDAGTSVVTQSNSSKLVLAFGPGRAYIQGFQVERLSTNVLSIDRARDVQLQNNRSISTDIGNYAYFNPGKTWGMPDITTGPIVTFYDKLIADTTVIMPYGEPVGQGRLMYLDRDSNGGYRAGFAAVKMTPGRSFERDVNMMSIPDPAGSQRYKAFSQSGNAKYVGPYDMSGSVAQTSSFVQISGGIAALANTSQIINAGGIDVYTLIPQQHFGGNLFYSASTGNSAWTYASSTIQLRGYQSAFKKELIAGDILTSRSSSNASISSWTVVSILSDTSMVISGGPIFNKFSSTGWSNVIQGAWTSGSISGVVSSGTTTALAVNVGGPLRNWANTAPLSSFVVTGTASSGNILTLTFPVGDTFRPNASSAYGTTAGVNAGFHPIQLGTIIAMFQFTSNTVGTGTGAIDVGSGRNAVFIEPNGCPDTGYTTTFTYAYNAAINGPDFVAPFGTSNSVSSWIVTSIFNNGFTMRGSAWTSSANAGVAINAGIVTLLRGTQHAVVPSTYAATTSYANLSTSAYIRLDTGTVFGVGTGNVARFKSEFRENQPIYLGTNNSSSYATRVNRIITDNRMLINYSTTSMTAWTSLGLINASTATITTVDTGSWYTGIASVFASEIYDNYSLGINAKRLTGQYQLLKYDGTTGSVAQHTAALIQGDRTARFTQELLPNDLVKINDVRLFITYISSNSQAYGLVWDTAITTNSGLYPVTRISNTLRNTASDKLVFKIADNVTRDDLKDNGYTVYKAQAVGGLSPGASTQIIITLAGATGSLNAEALVTTDPNYFLVAETTVGTLGQPLTVTAVTQISDTQVRLTLATAPATDTVRVIYPVKKSASSASQLGGVKTKTLNYNGTDTFLTSSLASRNRLNLSQADVFRIVKVMQATGFVATWDAATQATAVDVTEKYILDNGQRPMYYDLGAAVLRGGRAVPSGSIKIWYEYFVHGTGDFFSYASYNPLQVPRQAIPFFDNTSLADCIDYRTKLDATTNLLINSAVPRQGTTFDADLGFYLGRKEGLLLDKKGVFHNVAGASAITPKDPQLENHGDSLPMWILTLSPYTATVKAPDIFIKTLDHRRYTMKDIAGIDRRISALEAISSLSLLEVKTNGLQVRDNNDPTMERYKSGFFVDNFSDESNLEAGSDVNISIDPQARIMLPRTLTYQFGVGEKINYAGAVQSSLEQVPQAIARSYDNYRMTGSLMTLDYTTSTALQQTIATTSICVAPFLQVTFLGNLTITPDSDIFTSIQSVGNNVVYPPELQKNSRDDYLKALKGPVTQGGGARTQVVEINQIQLASVQQDANLVPFCRANTILMRATGMKPNTKYYTFFSDEDIRPYVQGAVKITFDSMPTLDFNNSRPDTTAWAKWRQLNESVWLQEKIVIGYHTEHRGKGKGGGNVTVADYGNITVRRTRTPDAAVTEQLLPDTSRGDGYRKALAGGASVYYYYNGAYRGSAVAVHQDGTTLYCVNTRGQLAASYIRAGTKVNGVAQQSYPGAFYVAVDQNDPKYVNSGLIRESAIMGDSTGCLYSDSKGVVVGLFDLPDTDVRKFLTGTKNLTITDSPTNDPDVWSSKADATYESRGFVINVTNNYVGVRSYVKRAYDPIAQSFKLPDQYTAGAFITDIDVYMAGKPSQPGVPLTLDLRQCDATGRPSGTDMVPGAEVTLYSDQITVDAKYGQIATKFTFREPVYLSPGKNYALVLRSDSQNYFAWSATLGQADVYQPTKSYSTQATLGSLFRSQDGTLWTEDQLSDLKFRINRAVFKTNVDAVARVINSPIPAGDLPINPFMLVHGSNKIRVHHPSHGLTKGDGVRYFSEYWKAQYTINPSVTLGGIPVTEIFGTTVTSADIVRPGDAQITVSAVDSLNKDYYTIQVTTPANLGAGSTTGISSINTGGTGVQGSKNALYHIINPAVKMLNFQETSVAFEAEMTEAFTYDSTQLGVTGTPYVRSSQPLNLNKLNYLNTPKIVLSGNNEYSRHAGGTVGGGTGATTWKDSFVGKFTMSTTDDAVSPAIDVSTFNVELKQHAIDNPSQNTRIPTVLPAIGTAFTGDTLFVDYEPVTLANYTIAFDGVREALVSTVTNTFDDVIPGIYVVISGSSIPGNNYTSSPILVASVSQDKTTLFLSGNVTNIAAGDPISVYTVREFIDEAGVGFGSNESKYICNKINLANAATSIKLIMDINIPTEADFDVYYKLGANNADFTAINWVKFAALPVYKKNDTRFDFTELTIDITDFDDAGNTQDFPEFTAFQIKIVMRSSNGARVPMFKSLRAIAHA